MEKWRRIVEGLLTKAQAAGTTEAERDTYVERATYLMAKYGIEEASARDKVTGQKVIWLEVSITNPHKSAKYELLNNITLVLGGHVVRMHTGKIRVFAYPGDLERIKLLYSSLLAQMLFGYASAKFYKPAGEHGKSFAHSWLHGFVFRVGQRMFLAKQRAERESDNLPVLRNRENDVVTAMYEEIPDLKVRKTKEIQLNSRAGYERGMAAGDRADLGGPKVGTPRPRRQIS